MMKKRVILGLATGTLMASGCGMGVGRDLSAIPPQHVIFDDVCGVQDYHDTIFLGKVAPPEVVTTNEIESTEGKHQQGGRTTFAFEAPFQLQTLRRLLKDNWSRVPEGLLTMPRVELEVRWSEKAGVKRVVTNEDAQIGLGQKTFDLPYHVCLSELLFGGPLYKTRRQLLGMPELVAPGAPEAAPAPVPQAAPAPAPVAAPVAAPPADAGVPDASAPDAGVAPPAVPAKKKKK